MAPVASRSTRYYFERKLQWKVHYESLRRIKKEIIIMRMLLLLLCLGEAKRKTCIIKRCNVKLQALSITEKPKKPAKLGDQANDDHL